MKNFKLSISAAFCILSAFLTGCAETEVVGINETENETGQEIILNISAPDALKTRAGSDHKLRFTAKLFKDRYNSSQGNQFLEKKQGVATDGECTIVFSVPQGDYSVLLFADYIPNTTEADSKGFYEDAYYDTSSNDEIIQMIAFTTNSSDHTLLQKHCINNDNYDCFSAYTGIINKTDMKYEKDFVLERAVAKVRFVSTTPLPAEVGEINFSKFYCFDIFKQFYETVTCEKQDNYMRLGSHVLQGMSNKEENEIFYFYTLAAKNKENLGNIEFKINFTDGTDPRTISIDQAISVTKNRITTVRGAFLQDEQEEVGDIILHLSTSQDWENEDPATSEENESF